MATIERIEAIPMSTFKNQIMPRQSAFGESQHPIYSRNLGNTCLFLLREAANKYHVGEKLEYSFNASAEFEHLHKCYEDFQKTYSWYPLPIIHFLEKIIRIWTLGTLWIDTDCDYLLINDYLENRKRYHKHYGMSLASARKKLPLQPVGINVLKFDDIARIASTHLEILQQERFEKPLPGTDQNADWRCIIEQVPFDGNQDNDGTGFGSEGSIEENPRHPGCPLCPHILNNAVWDKVESRFISNKLWDDAENSRLHKKVWDYSSSILQGYLSLNSYHSKSNSRVFVDQIYNHMPEIMQIIDSLKKQKTDSKKKSKKSYRSKNQDDEPITKLEIQNMYEVLKWDYPQLYPQYAGIRYIVTKETEGFHVGKYIMGDHHDGDLLHFKYDAWQQFKEIEERLRKIELLIQTMDFTTIKEFSPEINGELCVMGWRRIHDPTQWSLAPEELTKLKVEMRDQLKQKVQEDNEKNLPVPRIIMNELRNTYPGLDERYFVGLHWAKLIGMKVEEAGASAANGLTGNENFHIEQLSDHKTLLAEITQAMDALLEHLHDNHNKGTMKTKTVQASSKDIERIDKDPGFKSSISDSALQQTYKHAMFRCRLAMDVVKKDLRQRVSGTEKALSPVSFIQPIWYTPLLLNEDPAIEEEDRVILWHTAEFHLYESQDNIDRLNLPHQTEMENICMRLTRLSQKLHQAVKMTIADREKQKVKKGQSVGMKGVEADPEGKLMIYVEAAKSVLKCMDFWRNEIKKLETKCRQEIEKKTQELEDQRSSSDSAERHFSVDTPRTNEIDWNNLLLECDPILDEEDRALLWHAAAVERWELQDLQIKPQLPDLTKIEDNCRKFSSVGDKLESTVCALISDIEKKEAVGDGAATQEHERPPEERVALYIDTANAMLRCMHFWKDQLKEQGHTEYNQVIDNHKQKLEDFTRGFDKGGQRFSGEIGNHGENLRSSDSSHTLDDDESLDRPGEAVTSGKTGSDLVEERSSTAESAEGAAHSLVEMSRSDDAAASEVEHSQTQIEGTGKDKDDREQVV